MNVIVVPKLSVVQVDMHRYGLDELGLRKKYESDGKDVDSIFGSHKRQLASVAMLKRHFPDSICYREGFSKKVADEVDLVIAAGGDDHLKYVSHYITDTQILGLNTDPERSRGELLEDNIEEALEKLEKGEFEIVDETRIEVLVNDQPYLLAMSNYPLRRYDDPFGNFRYKIKFKGKSEEHKITSGVSAYTGNGIEDWPKGAGRYLRRKLPKFGPTKRKIGWIVHEPNDDYKLLCGLIKEGEELHIICYKDGSAIAPDAIKEHKQLVQSGNRVVFRIANKPLRHIRIVR